MEVFLKIHIIHTNSKISCMYDNPKNPKYLCVSKDLLHKTSHSNCMYLHHIPPISLARIYREENPRSDKLWVLNSTVPTYLYVHRVVHSVNPPGVCERHSKASEGSYIQSYITVGE